MNRIFNEYGALQQSPIGDELMMVLDNYESAMNAFINKNDLTPVEIRCVQAFADMSSTIFAAQILRRALAQRFLAGKSLSAYKMVCEDDGFIYYDPMIEFSYTEPKTNY